MRDILEQLALPMQERLDLIRHAIERRGQIAYFIATVRMNPGREITVTEVLYYTRDLVQRFRKL